MIPYVDVKLAQMVKATYPNLDVVWRPSSQIRKGLVESSSHSTTNLPGVGIFRSNIIDDQGQNNPYPSKYGENHGYISDSEGTEYALMTVRRRRYVIVSYELTGYAYKLSDLNDIERLSSFISSYNPVITGSGDGIEYNFNLDDTDTVYDHEVEERTDKVRFYSFTKNFTVNTFWMIEENVRTVLTIDLNTYNTITSGDPLPEDLVHTESLISDSNGIISIGTIDNWEIEGSGGFKSSGISDYSFN